MVHCTLNVQMRHPGCRSGSAFYAPQHDFSSRRATFLTLPHFRRAAFNRLCTLSFTLFATEESHDEARNTGGR